MLKSLGKPWIAENGPLEALSICFCQTESREALSQDKNNPSICCSTRPDLGQTGPESR